MCQDMQVLATRTSR